MPLVDRRRLLGAALCLLVALGALLACDSAVRLLYGNLVRGDAEFLFRGLSGWDAAEVRELDAYNTPEYKRALAGRLGDPDLAAYLEPQNFWMSAVPRDVPGAAAPPKAAGRKRVLFLGDSVLYGNDDKGRTLPAEDIFTGLLKRREAGCEIVNLGVPGANIYQVHSLFDHFYPRLRPDLVVYVLSSNDPLPTVFLKRLRGGMILFVEYLFALGPDGRLVLKDPAPAPLARLLRRSAMYELWRSYSVPAGQVPEEVRERFRRLLLALAGDMGERCRKDGVPFVVFCATHPAFSDYLRDSGLAAGLASRSAGFEELALPPSGLLPDGYHLSPEGHRAAAGFLDGVIRRRLGAPRKPGSRS